MTTTTLTYECPPAGCWYEGHQMRQEVVYEDQRCMEEEQRKVWKGMLENVLLHRLNHPKA